MTLLVKVVESMDAKSALNIARQKQMKDLAVFMKKCEKQIEKAAKRGKNECLVWIHFDNNKEVYDLAVQSLNQSYHASIVTRASDGCLCTIWRKYILISWSKPKIGLNF